MLWLVATADIVTSVANMSKNTRVIWLLLLIDYSNTSYFQPARAATYYLYPRTTIKYRCIKERDRKFIRRKFGRRNFGRGKLCRRKFCRKKFRRTEILLYGTFAVRNFYRTEFLSRVVEIQINRRLHCSSTKNNVKYLYVKLSTLCFIPCFHGLLNLKTYTFRCIVVRFHHT